mmetsp:Transcript_25407/g.54648  ORF Transcript_25407/g.54648 Transcript_25407/m.54648 type:complete len:210 (+) Transcript_25407:184-813(+)
MGVFNTVKGTVQVLRLWRGENQAAQNIFCWHFTQHCKFVRSCINIIPREEFQPIDTHSKVQPLRFRICHHWSNIIILLLLLLSTPSGGCIGQIRAFIKSASNIIITIILRVILIDGIIQRHPPRARPKTRRAIRLPSTIHDCSSNIPTQHEIPTSLKVLHALICLYDEQEIGHLQSKLQSDTEAVHSHGRGSGPRSIGKAGYYNARSTL